MDLHPDFKDLLAELDRAAAEFALVGGYAVGHWAKPRATILRRIDGVDTEGVLARCVRVDIGGLSLRVIALQDLIANKRASGRPQDLADVAVLERVR